MLMQLRFKEQLSRFLDFSEDKAIMINNADWLLELNYVDFLREIGVHFSVNRMLTADCYKSRMEKGLTFLEFNYMLMQSYDFLELNKRFDCTMQLGGNDQWSNILGGVELIRRKEGKDAFGMTFKLLTTSEGKKMGKTEKGAVWLDAEKTTPYEFFQYWRNVEDAKVEQCLGLLTFLPMDEVRRLGKLEGAEINQAKEVLAFELTKIIHGEVEAIKAVEASKALFAGGAKTGSIPTTSIGTDELSEGIDAIGLMLKSGLVPSRSEGRRVIEQGGLKMNEEKITDINQQITVESFINNELLLQKGKKAFHVIKLI
jgi:tyrosyl-tRNA synthetase